MPEPTSFARTLTGRIAEYQELLALVDEAPGLTVLSCDPFSGTSALLASVADDTRQPCVLVDARTCADTLDLATAIADAAVSKLAADAAEWWVGLGSPSSTAGLRLRAALSAHDLHLDDLRLGAGHPLARLDEALRLACALAERRVTVIIDHAGPLLWQRGTAGARSLLEQLRATRQVLPELDLVIVEFADGTAAAALADQKHPMYRAGAVHRIRRPRPDRFVDDLASTRPTTGVKVALLRGCADLAAGVPCLTWRATELAPHGGGGAAAVSGWRELRRITEPSTAREWDTLRRVHPLAQTIVAVIANGLRPHTIAANDKSIGDGLRVMRALGIAWQPQSRRWAVADPLLAAYARDHAQPWVRRRRQDAPLPLSEDDEPQSAPSAAD